MVDETVDPQLFHHLSILTGGTQIPPLNIVEPVVCDADPNHEAPHPSSFRLLDLPQGAPYSVERTTAWHYRVSHNWAWFEVVPFVLSPTHRRLQEFSRSKPIRPPYKPPNF